MAEKDKNRGKADNARAARLAAALRDNLRRRKAQARGREEGAAADAAPPQPDRKRDEPERS